MNMQTVPVDSINTDPANARVGYSPRPGVTLTRMSFRDVLQTRENTGRNKLADMARELGYDYMLYRGVVYHVQSGCEVDTGLTASDVL